VDEIIKGDVDGVVPRSLNAILKKIHNEQVVTWSHSCVFWNANSGDNIVDNPLIAKLEMRS
jgi:hypothetical protein